MINADITATGESMKHKPYVIDELCRIVRYLLDAKTCSESFLVRLSLADLFSLGHMSSFQSGNL